MSDIVSSRIVGGRAVPHRFSDQSDGSYAPTTKIVGTATVRDSTGTKTSSAVSATQAIATLLAANSSRKCAFFKNVGTNTAYIGAAGITSSTGYPLAAGAEFIDRYSTDIWHVICATGETASVRVIEVA